MIEITTSDEKTFKFQKSKKGLYVYIGHRFFSCTFDTPMVVGGYFRVKYLTDKGEQRFLGSPCSIIEIIK